jgi:hypothetical protein
VTRDDLHLITDVVLLFRSLELAHCEFLCFWFTAGGKLRLIPIIYFAEGISVRTDVMSKAGKAIVKIMITSI